MKSKTNQQLKDWILKQNLDNYGYDQRWFQKMVQHKARLKRKVKTMSDAEIRRSLAKAGILGQDRRLEKTQQMKVIKTKEGKTKLVPTGKRVWKYTTGQSFNEELINILQIPATKGKKSFWETQEEWVNRGYLG